MVATETVVSEIDIFTSSTCNFNLVILNRMKNKKYNTIVGTSGTLTTRSTWLALGAYWPSVFRDLVFLHGQVLAHLDY